MALDDPPPAPPSGLAPGPLLTPGDAASSGARIPVRSWLALAVICVAALLAYTDRMVFSQLVGPLRAELGIGDAQAGLMLGTGFAVSYALAGLLSGVLADRFSRRLLMVGGVLLWSAATFAMAFATALPAIVGARLVVGVGEAALFPAAVSLLADIFPPARRGLALSALFSASAAGTGIAAIVGGVLLDAFQHQAAFPHLFVVLTPWRETVAVLGIAGVAVAALFLLVAEPPRGVLDPANGPARVGGLSVWPILWTTIASLTLWSVADYALQTWMPALLSRRFAAGPLTVATHFGPAALWSLIAAPAIGGVLADVAVRRRWSGGKLLVAAVSMMLAPLSLILVLAPSMDATLAIYVGYNLLVGIGGTATLAAQQDVAPAHLRGRIVAVQVFLFAAAGLAIGPLAVGAVSDRLAGDPAGLGKAMLVVALPMLLLSAILMVRAAVLAAGRDRSLAHAVEGRPA